MLYDTFDFDYSLLGLPNIDNNIDLMDVKDGFLKGNMFKNEYIPYKNYKANNIKPTSELEAKLLNVMQYEFAINDLNLYLDLNPLDTYAINKLNQYIDNKNMYQSEYEKSYGPLEVCGDYTNKFDWVNNWPWMDSRGDKYV